MKLLRHRRERGTRPTWATGLSDREYRTLCDQIDLQLDGTGVTYTWSEANETMTLELSERYTATAYFNNLATMWRLATDLERPALVADHINGLLTQEPVPATFDEAAPRLKARIVTPHYMTGPDIVYRPLTEEFGAVPVIEMAHSRHTVIAYTLEKWGVPAEAVWDVAVANVHSEENLRDEWTPLQFGVRVHAIFGATPFGAARALDLARYLEPEHGLGALVGIPSGTELISHTIQTQAYELARDFMFNAVSRLYEEEEIDAVSPHLYWWQQGRWTRLTELSGNRLLWNPPAEFTRLLDDLPRAG